MLYDMKNFHVRLHKTLKYTGLPTKFHNCLFTSAGTCLFHIVHGALWGSKYPVCAPDAQVLFLSGARMLHTQHSAVQALPSGVYTAKAPFLLPAPSSSTQTPFPSREKSAMLGIRTGDLSDQSQAL
jgi:hypothetical protein